MPASSPIPGKPRPTPAGRRRREGGSRDRHGFTLLLLALCVALAGCTTVPFDPAQERSYSHDRPYETRLWRSIASLAPEDPDASGFLLLTDGPQALSVRISMARMAEHTLDVQYYIWASDPSGALLARELVRAADRGVRVRLLLDDMDTGGEDRVISAIHDHPNIEVRLFNPFARRQVRTIDFLTRLPRVNQRMHNKLLVADGAVAVVGGRNVADDYFGLSSESNFRDVDVLSIGPVATELGESFDGFWNSRWAIPADDVVGPAADSQALDERLDGLVADRRFGFDTERGADELYATLAREAQRLDWAVAEVLADSPDKLDGAPSGIGGDDAWTEGIREELLIEAAYFVPGNDGVATLAALVERGVRVRVLTNSLASNDVLAAHAGYANYRKKLLRAGVELYEYRVTPETRPAVSWFRGESRASLHSKVLVLDRERAFIGSYNLDPRSRDINTEIGVLINSPKLARELAAFMDAGVTPESAYRVKFAENGRSLRWFDASTPDEGLKKDPDSSALQRGIATVLGWLPIESQL